ncbi:MAG: hypothetical protein U1F36_04240 [Planctomycetota bacterium]
MGPRSKRRLAFLMLLPLGAAVAHPGPSVGIEFRVDEHAVVARVLGEQATLARWLDKADPERPWVAPLDPTETARLRSAIEALFRTRNLVEVDGCTQPCECVAVEVPPLDSTGYGTPALQFDLRYRCTARPQSIHLVWKVFEHLTWFNEIKLPLMFREFGETSLGYVTPAEPEFTWHPSAIAPRTVERPAEISGAAGIYALPLLSLGVVLAALIALPFTRRRSTRLSIVASALATAFFARDLGTLRVASPFRVDSLPTDPAQATAIVDGLLRNLYAAFDARREEEIYDALAVSVVPELVSDLYGQIYESLILRNQSGAVCQIEKVDIESRSIDLAAAVEPWDLLPAERAAGIHFRAEWGWTVRGMVSHWGHRHTRTNRYDVKMWICLDRGSWRIGSFEVQDLKRTDSDG